MIFRPKFSLIAGYSSRDDLFDQVVTLAWQRLEGRRFTTRSGAMRSGEAAIRWASARVGFVGRFMVEGEVDTGDINPVVERLEALLKVI